MTKSSLNQKNKELNYGEISDAIIDKVKTMQNHVYEIYNYIDDLGLKFNRLQNELEDLVALHLTGKPHISQYVRELDLEELLKYSTNKAMENISEQAMKACTNEVIPNGLAKTVSNTVKKRKTATKKTNSVRKPHDRK
jgi:hypothetical protein